MPDIIWKKFFMIVNQVLHYPFGELTSQDIVLRPPDRMQVHRREKVSMSNSALTSQFSHARLRNAVNEILQQEYNKFAEEQQFISLKYDMFYQDLIVLENKICDGYGSPADYARRDDLRVRLNDLTEQEFDTTSRLYEISQVAEVNNNFRIVGVSLAQGTRTPVYNVNLA